tara:strand:- start:425 stop:1585 length:1161 start_codon:yes stop_codon:yes gene_type:complete
VPHTLKPKTKSKRSSSTPIDRAKKRRRTATLTAIDLFAGAGGFSLAAEKAKLKVLAAVEYDKWAQATYTANFIEGRAKADQHRLYGDILDIEPSDMLTDVGLCKDELDILIGGPPCQGFSSHRLNDAGVDDPRNGLLLRYFDFVKGLRPKVFLVENVSGMLWKRHADYVQRFKNLANDHDYKLIGGGPLVINARDFGVPQSRKRVFILGVRKDIEILDSFIWPPQPTHFAPNSDEVVDLGKTVWKAAATVFKKSLKRSDPNNLHMQPGAEMVDRFRDTPPNGGSRKNILRCHLKHSGHKDTYGRIDPSKPAPTMTTGCINPSKGRFIHPTEHHGITARHAARIQTFPENFIFKGGLGHAGKQIGNAVPVKLGQYILSYISEHILEK